MLNKILPSAADAVQHIHDGAVILCGGFASVGFADELLEAVHAQGTRNLTLVANNPAVAERGMALLLRDRRISKLVCSYSRKEGTTLIEDLIVFLTAECCAGEAERCFPKRSCTRGPAGGR